MNIFEWEKKYTSQVNVYKVEGVESKGQAEKIIEDFKVALSNEKIVLWGAGTVGRVFYLLLKELGISIEAVVDKKGEDISFLDGIKVLSICEEQLGEKLKDALVIATVNRNVYAEIEQDIILKKGNLSNVICGHNIHMVAQSALCMSKACNNVGEISLKNCYECTCLDNTCKSLARYLKRINNYDESQAMGTEQIEMIGYLLSNICTLNCKNCCESVPYMEKGQKHFVSADVVLSDIRKMSAACRFLILLEFIGGEPFLHPELPYIIQEALKINNIGMIHIFTNGTIVPSDELCKVLSNGRVTVYLSNYQASYPERFITIPRQTAAKLEESGVQYFYGKKQDWKDFSSYDFQDDTSDELLIRYKDCFLHNCNRLMEGKLYVCPHQYAGIKLGKLSERNVVDIHNYTDEQLAEILGEFKNYSFIDACRYCTMPYKAKTVISGEQF